ncbi:phage protein [Lysinibacillus sphaericus]|uniref:phage protein n=1 Tax=Lysinibacillus sphaericus TaxID=1421 RepID=UPI003810CA51
MSKLFKRYVEVVTGNLKFNNTDLDIEFEVPFDDDLEPNISEITIYNLSESTRNKLKRGEVISITAGYVEDKGLILNGRINSITTTPLGADRATVIKVIDTYSFNVKKTLQRSYKGKIKADAIIKDLVKALGLKVAVLKLPKNKLYDKGFSINGEIFKKIQDVANDCGASAYISRQQTYIRPITEGDNHKFVLSPDTGLVGSPEYFETERKGIVMKGYKAKSLLQHRMNTASIIELQSIVTKSKVRVKKGKHICKGNSFYTEVEAIL